jgi:hypothetical protein
MKGGISQNTERKQLIKGHFLPTRLLRGTNQRMKKNQAEQARGYLHTNKYRGRNKLEHGKEARE